MQQQRCGENSSCELLCADFQIKYRSSAGFVILWALLRTQYQAGVVSLAPDFGLHVRCMGFTQAETTPYTMLGAMKSR